MLRTKKFAFANDCFQHELNAEIDVYVQALIIEIVNETPNTKAGNHLSKQLVRYGTSVSLNYGEVQSGESRKDFIHKMKIVLKELRETFICLKIIYRTKLYKSLQKLESA